MSSLTRLEWLYRALTSGPRATLYRAVLAVLVCLPLAWGVVQAPDNGLVHGVLPGLGVLAVLAAAIPFYHRSIWLYMGVAVAAFLITGQLICLAFALYAAVRARKAAVTVVLVAVPLAVALFDPESLVVAGDNHATTVTTTWVIVSSPVVLGLAVNVLAEAATLHTERERERLRLRDSLLRERRMLQREHLVQSIHDGVGHQISLMSVQSMTIGARPDMPPDVKEKCELIQDAGANAMGALQNVLRVLKQSDEDHAAELPGQDGSIGDLDDLVATYQQYGLDVATWQESAPEMDGDTSALLYRAAEEALSNAARHAHGSRVRLGLRREAGSVTLEAVNTAPPPGTASLPGTGNGLGQLRDAARRAGGTLETGEMPDGGYRLALTLPDVG